ncbi:hypothetical protein ACFL4N_00195 [Thermodesulfobacteriota bacterium]
MNKVLLGRKHRMIPVPWFLFTRILRRGAKKTKSILGGLDDEHRRVHHFVVKELPGLAGPMPPDFIAERLRLDETRVIQILDELERRLIFLFRPGGRDVVWAYPITAEPTPHRLTFSSGERLWAA